MHIAILETLLVDVGIKCLARVIFPTVKFIPELHACACLLK